MNKIILSTLSIIVIISTLAFTSSKGTLGHYMPAAPFSTGPLASNTGAPDETNCTTCHVSGTAQDGTDMIIDNLSSMNYEYIPGNTLSIEISIETPGTKNGFQLVALRDSDNESVGNWVAGTGTQTLSGMGRDYIEHNSTGSTMDTWSFEWEAPANDEGDITFYIASVVANGDQTPMNDDVYLKEINLSSLFIGVDENTLTKDSFFAYFSNGEAEVSFGLENSSNVSLNILDINGKTVFQKSYGMLDSGKHSVRPDMNNMADGIYILNLELNNQRHTEKIKVQ